MNLAAYTTYHLHNTLFPYIIRVMAACKLCGEPVGWGQYYGHMWKKHPKEAEAQRQIAQAKFMENTRKRREEQGGNGSRPATKPSAALTRAPAGNIQESISVAITPRRFEMSSTLIWQALAAAIREWNWPKDITPEDFLDTYLYHSFKQRGILLGGYQVLETEKNRGNTMEERISSH